MPDPRTNKSIASRLDVEFDRSPDPLRCIRRVVIWLCALIPLLLLGLAAIAEQQKIYQAGPVSSAHQLFGHDCKTCHTRWGQPLLRLVTGDDHARSVEDATCRKCHGQTLVDHHRAVIESDVRDCVMCHKEHHGEELLATVGDAHCVACHADLQQHTKKKNDTTFMAKITSLVDHPEFALKRRGPQGGKLPGEDQYPGKDHQVHQRAQWLDEAGKWTWSDRANLRFSHAQHLAVGGLPLPHNAPGNTTGRELKILECGSCHEPAEDRRYMKPISYEAHCRQCHPLDFNTQLHQVDPALNLQGALPHVSPKLIRGLLRERLLSHAKSHPEVVARTPPAKTSRLPSKSSSDSPATAAAQEVTSEERHQWAERLLADGENKIFRSVKNGCTTCHVAQQNARSDSSDNSDLLGWEIVSPNLPTRWMPHGQFRHDRHTMLRCVDCHYKNRHSETHGSAEAQSDGSLKTLLGSKTASDILMPSIETCRQCHGPTSQAKGQGSARSDCVTCHRFHHPEYAEPFPGRSIEEYLQSPAE